MPKTVHPIRNEKWELLSQIAESLELTETQKRQAKESYQAVAKVLSESGEPLLKDVKIYPQGSFRLGTTVKPIGRDEFDLDFVCHLPVNSFNHAPRDIYNLIGSVLRNHGTYKKMLEPKKRCWRLNYSGNFHMDITPSTIDELHYQKGEKVPDRELSSWKESNPIGYAEWVEQIDSISPIQDFSRQIFTESASVEPLETDNSNNGVLKRFVQIIKRNRDVYFQKHPLSDYAPISILLTTIATKAYKQCVHNRSYFDMLELLEDVLQTMPDFIEKHSMPTGATYYRIENPSQPKENFAEKWNTIVLYERVFTEWNENFVQLIRALRLLQGQGLDVYADRMKELFGKMPVERALEARAKLLHAHKANGSLGVLAGSGLVNNSTDAIVPRKNTFFGS